MSSVTSKYAWSLSGTLSGRAGEVAVGERERDPFDGATENGCFEVFRLRKHATLEDGGRVDTQTPVEFSTWDIVIHALSGGRWDGWVRERSICVARYEHRVTLRKSARRLSLGYDGSKRSWAAAFLSLAAMAADVALAPCASPWIV
jgi:hypothetical protein